MAFEIVGREEELGSLGAFLQEEAGGPRALVLEGEAGIGKSTLWRAGVEEAQEQGFRVLSSRPTEAERALAHVVLGDLFEGILDEVLPTLSAPRRQALEVALLLDEAPEQPIDPRTLGVAVRTALEALAAQGPIVLAVDDIQWLDPSSTSALAFALRRMADDRVPSAPRQADCRRRAAVGARASTRAGESPPAVGHAPQRRRAPSVPARPGREPVRATDAVAHSRGLGGEPVLCAGAGPRSRRRCRPLATAPCSRDARGTRGRKARRSPGRDPRGAQARLSVGCAVVLAPGAGGDRARRSRMRQSTRT